MNGTSVLYRDQYGAAVWAKSARELQRIVHGRLSKMYLDKRDGRTMHIGYVVGARWFQAYIPYEKQV